MRGTPFVSLGIAGLLAACVAASHRSSADDDAPAHQEGDSGVQQPPAPGNDAGSAFDGGIPAPPPGADAGALSGPPPDVDAGILSFDPALLPVPPPPTPDDPAACAPRALPFPSSDAQPDRPCTERGSLPDGGSWWTSAFRYDATGRVVYREDHTSYGNDSTYTLEEDGGVRIETWVQQGRLSKQDVTLTDGNTVQVDDFKAGADGGLFLNQRSIWQYDGEGRPLNLDDLKPDADGGLVLNDRSTWQYDGEGRPVEWNRLVPDADGGPGTSSHTTWLYDAEGRQRYVVSQSTGQARRVERHVYDSKGHEYYVDVSDYWPGHSQVANHSFTSRSWFANGTQAHEYWTCDIVGGAPCAQRETRWEPCGNVAYVFDSGGWGLGCFYSAEDRSWGADGRPLKSHMNWCDLGGRIFDSNESYQTDPDGLVVSGTILTSNPPGAIIPVPERQVDSYAYDEAKRLVDRSIDGNSVFHARFDAEGRLIELLNGALRRWTYDGCARP
jgi:hypothetical protein